jgi:hypothetical protein
MLNNTNIETEIHNGKTAMFYEVGDLHVTITPLRSRCGAFAVRMKDGERYLMVDSSLPQAEQDKLVSDYVANGYTWPQ